MTESMGCGNRLGGTNWDVVFDQIDKTEDEQAKHAMKMLAAAIAAVEGRLDRLHRTSQGLGPL